MFKKCALFLLLPYVGFAGSFFHNHVGYDLHGEKVALYKGSESLVGQNFRLVDGVGAVAFEAPISQSGNVADWGAYGGPYYTLDFSAFQGVGAYSIELGEGGALQSSNAFAIGPQLQFDKSVDKLLSFFKESRADDEDVWGKDLAVSFYGTKHSGTRDVRGGWYDASGDISKYLSHQNISNYSIPQQIPMTAWVLAKVAEDFPGEFEKRGLLEQLEAEALWGADYLKRVTDAEGFMYNIIFDGWSGNLGRRRITSWHSSTGIFTEDYESAFREGAGVAIAALARIARWQKAGQFAAAEYQAAAVQAFAHLEQNNLKYCDDGVENLLDDYTSLLAAVELKRLTGLEHYQQYASLRAENILAKMDEAGFLWADKNKTWAYFHAAEAGLPVIALIEYLRLNPPLEQKIRIENGVQKILGHLEAISVKEANPFTYAKQMVVVNAQLKENFFISHDNGTGYWWQGESARQGSIVAAIALAKLYFGEGLKSDKKHRLASAQIDWILGKNPYDVSMFSGLGRNNPAEYSGVKDPVHGHLDGGISNGITGVNMDGSGIEWNPSFTTNEQWKKWRWIEQWLPHSTWFLLGVTTLTKWRDEGSLVPATKIPMLNTKEEWTEVYSLDGKKVLAFKGKLMSWQNEKLVKGIYFLKNGSKVTRRILGVQ